MASPSRPHFSVSVNLLTLLFASPSPAQNAWQLFHKMQAALGGSDKIASVRDFERIVRADTWDSDGKPRGVVRKRVRFIRPSYLRIDQVGSFDAYVLYLNGTSGWEILPDGAFAVLAESELRFAQGHLSGLNLVFWLADRDPSRVITSPAPNVIVVSSKGDSSQRTAVTLDSVTFLPVKQTEISHAGSDHPVHQELRLDRWGVSGGVQFPRHISNFHDGKKLAEITMEQTNLNNGIKASDVAIKPPDLKPVMSRP